MDIAAALVAENAAFADLIADADLSVAVPTCPDWTLQQLMVHVGRGDRWCTQIVAQESGEYVDPRMVPAGKPPTGRADEIAWLREGVRALLAAVGATGPQTAVHRADAALALGAAFDLDPVIAADGITEYPTPVSVRPASGPSWGGRTESPWTTSTERPPRPCAARPGTCFWRSCGAAARRTSAWKCSAMRRSGTPGWPAHRSEPVL